MILRFLLLVTVLLMPPSVSWAADWSLNAQEETYPLASRMSVFEDRTTALTHEEVTRAPVVQKFSRVDRAVPSFGFNPSAFWARTSVSLPDDAPRQWVLNFAYAPMQEVDVFVRHADGVMEHARSGSIVPIIDRPMRARTHAFPLELRPGTTTIHVRIAGRSSKSLPVELVNASYFGSVMARESSVFGAAYGIAAGFTFYSLIMGLFGRDRTYVTHALFLVLSGFAFANIYGHGQWWWPWLWDGVSVSLIPASIFMAAAATFAFAAVFLADDLRTIRHGGVFQRIGYVHAVLSLVTLVLPYSVAILLAIFAVCLSVVLLMWLSIVLTRRGSMSARHYLTAWSAILMASVIFALKTLGVLPPSLLTEYALIMGWTLQSLLLSVGVATRLRTLKQEKESTLKNLIESERLASIGMLSAGVAHEINNPTNVIRLSSQTLEAHLEETRAFLEGLLEDDDTDMRQELASRFGKMTGQTKLITDGAERISGIVHGMRNSSRKGDDTRGLFDPIKGLESTLTLVRVNYDRSVKFTWGSFDRCQVMGHPSELNQVFMNLLVNACHAIEERTQKEANHAGEVHLSAALHAAEYHIAIRDNGCGMREDVRARLSEPFFTTKGEERGTGLGMFICKRILDEHGGRLDITTRWGEGSTFTVILPLGVASAQ